MEIWASSADVFGYGCVFFVVGFLLGEWKEMNKRWSKYDD